MKTQQQAKEWINSHTNKGVDFDGMYGYQCMDLAVAYIYYVTDGQVQMWGNAKDAINNNFKGLCTVYRNTPSFKPQLGDVAVYTSGFYATYGHIQVVISGNLNYYVCLEQNWNGNGASYQELATVRTHYYDGVTHFIRPHFTGQRQKQSKNSKKPSKPSKPSKKSKPQTEFKWYGRFTAHESNTKPIVVRTSPSLNGQIVDGDSWIFPNEYVNFDRIYKRDHYWWLGFHYVQKGSSKERFFMPIGKIEDKQEKILNEKNLWGKLEVN